MASMLNRNHTQLRIDKPIYHFWHCRVGKPQSEIKDLQSARSRSIGVVALDANDVLAHILGLGFTDLRGINHEGSVDLIDLRSLDNLITKEGTVDLLEEQYFWSLNYVYTRGTDITGSGSTFFGIVAPTAALAIKGFEDYMESKRLQVSPVVLNKTFVLGINKRGTVNHLLLRQIDKTIYGKWDKVTEVLTPVAG